MPPRLRDIDIEQREADLRVDDVVIGPVFRRERVFVERLQALVKVDVVVALLLVSPAELKSSSSRSKSSPLYLCRPWPGRRNGRERERRVNELFRDLAEIYSLTFTRTAGKNKQN